MSGGGAERQVIEILRRLDRNRFQPFLYLAMKQGELLGEIPADVPVFAYWDGTPESLPRKLLRLMKLTRLARYAHLANVLGRQRIDVVYDRTYLATLDAAGGCMIRPTPRISCCVVDPQPELELHARWSKSFSWWLAQRAYASASIVLANSEGLRARLIDYFHLKPDHVKVAHNILAGIDSSPNSTDSAGKSVERSSSTFTIVTAGRLHPQKGQRYLLEAVKELVHRRNRELKLIILGMGESEAELKDFVRTHQLEQQVTFAGFVSNPRSYYATADLFVLPSLYEGMPNALIEAAASGIPVLSTDCPCGPSEILDNGRCGGLVPPADSNALANAIADAMDHPDAWRTRAIAAKARVEQLFNPETGIRRLEQLLEEAVSPR